MLKKFNNSKNDKGDGKMNSKNSLLRLGIAAMMLCLLAATFITGCGGENPTGAAASSTNNSSSTAASSNLPTQATGTVTIRGSILDTSTGTFVDNKNAKLTVSAKFIGPDRITSVAATDNRAYSITLIQGFYLITISDAAGIYETRSEIVDLTNATTQRFDFSLLPKVISVAPSSVNFFGKIIDSLNKTPVMAAVLTITNKDTKQSYQASTLVNGEFSFIGISSGTYSIKVEKNGFVETTVELRLADEIWFGNKKIAAKDDFKDGDAVTREGYNLGSVSIAQLWTQTGAFQGILYDPLLAVKTPFTNSTLVLWFDSNPRDQYAPEVMFRWLETNSSGYFSMKNLPAGYYLITRLLDTPTAVSNPSGDIIGYSFATGVTSWHQVVPGAVTLIPVQEE